LAKSVWNTMKSTDSRECRNCHNFSAMDISKQNSRARNRHVEAQGKGQTCIDCHKGIAHELPAGAFAAEKELNEAN
jgi:cytochrome c-type protein NapC